MSETIIWWCLLRSDDPRFVEEAARLSGAELRGGGAAHGSSATERPAAGRGGRMDADSFLSKREERVFDSLRSSKRRQEWLLGRMVAKGLARALLASKGEPHPAAAITVAAAEDGSPYVELEGAGVLPVTVSISHRAGLALCALVEAPGAPLGADLELCEPRPPGFAADFFTPAEVDSLPAIASDSGPPAFVPAHSRPGPSSWPTRPIDFSPGALPCASTHVAAAALNSTPGALPCAPTHAAAAAPDPASEAAQAHWRAIAEIWSLKESALKAARLGLRADTRSVQVGARGRPKAGWSEAALELQLPGAPRRALGLARWHGSHVVTLAWLGEGRPVARQLGE
ncbi:MAG: 4'-phosphopantetheinyl transferase family protein [Myxococcales bacterium]